MGVSPKRGAAAQSANVPAEGQLRHRRPSHTSPQFGSSELLKDYGSSDEDDPTSRPNSPCPVSPIVGDEVSGRRIHQQQVQVAKAEGKLKKILTRSIMGFFMIAAFLGIVWAGHLYVSALVVCLQSLVFREMVNVRYKEAREREIPTFRTLQWSWFTVAIFFTYGDFLHEFVLAHRSLMWLAHITKWHSWIAFSLYCCIFMLSVLTLRKGLYRYQVSQLTWTIVTICMIVAQLKFVAHNIFNGLFWFFFPCSLVIFNDITAYFCGMTLGRKLIKAPFLRISPNKTWEGFIGGFFCTCIFAFLFASWLSRFEWFVCPLEDLSLVPKHLECKPDKVFTRQELQVPFGVLKFLKSFLFIDLPQQLHVWDVKPVQLHGVVMAAFISIIAPFGGFWASAIKRAYGIKDFDSIIPGHGGVTDRMDCQFITALFVFVYYNTFIRPSMISVNHLAASASLLTLDEQRELYEELGRMLQGG